jgi:hypothetical protein
MLLSAKLWYLDSAKQVVKAHYLCELRKYLAAVAKHFVISPLANLFRNFLAMIHRKEAVQVGQKTDGYYQTTLTSGLSCLLL